MTPPARLFLLHARDRVTAMLVGGTGGRRLRVAHAFHRYSRVRRGPFVCLDARRDDALLRAALHAWINGAPRPAGDPIATAERGTLMIDSIAAMPAQTQRLLLEFTRSCMNAGPADSCSGWIGRLIAADGRTLWKAVRAGEFSSLLLDALDKLRIDLPAPAVRTEQRLSA